MLGVSLFSLHYTVKKLGIIPVVPNWMTAQYLFPHHIRQLREYFKQQKDSSKV